MNDEHACPECGLPMKLAPRHTRHRQPTRAAYVLLPSVWRSPHGGGRAPRIAHHAVGHRARLSTPYDVGGPNITDTRLHPHRGHRKRSASLPRGKSLPLVQTSVSQSSCRLNPHFRLCFIPSLPSSKQRICTAQDKVRASQGSPQGYRTNSEQRHHVQAHTFYQLVSSTFGLLDSRESLSRFACLLSPVCCVGVFKVAPARPYWKGYLKLSLVACPIALYPASSSSERVSFRQINKKTGNRLRQQLVGDVTREPVDSADKGRG